MLADVIRAFGFGSGVPLLGLALSAAVAALGTWAAVLWHRRGEVALAVMLGGVATLLASPVSWLHHFVWIVPLAVVLILDLLPFPEPPRLPAVVQRARAALLRLGRGGTVPEPAEQRRRRAVLERSRRT